MAAPEPDACRTGAKPTVDDEIGFQLGKTVPDGRKNMASLAWLSERRKP